MLTLHNIRGKTMNPATPHRTGPHAVWAAQAIACIVIYAWLNPRWGNHMLPQAWHEMTWATALSVVLLGALSAQHLTSPQRPLSSPWLACLIAVILLNLAALALMDLGQVNASPERDPWRPMSFHTTLALALVAFFLHAQNRHADTWRMAVGLALATLALVVPTLGYVFGVDAAVGQTALIRMSPHTLFALWLIHGTLMLACCDVDDMMRSPVWGTAMQRLQHLVNAVDRLF